MGITIFYRGRLADLTRVEDFEDRLLDLALEFGGQAQIWRTQDDSAPERMVRGVILNLAPGLEPTSLLLSPEGWLVGLVDIEDAERGQLKEPPWCFTKTQFGPVEGHVALVEMLTVLQREFLPDLEVRDEAGYWETRDLKELVRQQSFLQKAIDGLTEGLQRHGLSREAAEDPDILIRHIERVAARVHRILQRPAEHPPVSFPDDDEAEPDPATTEALWDQMFKHNRRQQERLQRALEERRQQGEGDEAAFDNAMRDLGLEAPEEEDEAEDDSWDDEENDEPEEEEFTSDEDDFLNDDSEDGLRGHHPLLQRAQDLLKELHDTFAGADAQFTPALHTLFQGAGDAMGGLAQALSRHAREDDSGEYGLNVVQLKRALRGLAFARGALFPLRPAVSAEQFKKLYGALEQLEQDVFQELSRLRSEQGEAEEP